MRDVHHLRFHAFIVTCSAADEPGTGYALVLRDWSFVKLKNRPRKNLGFRIIGTMVSHPALDTYPIGSEWFSTEIKGMLCDNIMVSENSTTYRLLGPAAAARHNAQSRLANIMQPFCQSVWPHNARELLNEVSDFFSTEQESEIPFQNPQSDQELRERRMAYFAPGSAQRA